MMSCDKKLGHAVNVILAYGALNGTCIYSNPHTYCLPRDYVCELRLFYSKLSYKLSIRNLSARWVASTGERKREFKRPN